jgi:hypothetical protein
MKPTESEAAFLDLDYRRGGPPFVELAETIEGENASIVDAEHGAELKTLRACLDCLYAIASEFAWHLNTPHVAIQNKATMILFSTFHKNLIALHTSLKLTRLGLYGPARSMLRHVYEALLIAKFCALSNETTLFEKWKEGDVVYLTNGVLKKLLAPDTSAFSDLWGLLSNYSHATVYAQQVNLSVHASPDDVPLNLVYLRILVDCQAHLLGSHLVTPSMQYYTKRYRRGADPCPGCGRSCGTI